MSKIIRKAHTWVIGVIIVILVAVGLTMVSYFARQVDVTVSQDIICLGNGTSSDPAISKKLYGWPFHFRTVITREWGNCYHDTSDSPEVTDDFIVRNFVLNIVIYSIPATGVLLLLRRLQQPRRKE